MARFPQLPDSPSPTDGQALTFDAEIMRWVPTTVVPVGEWAAAATPIVHARTESDTTPRWQTNLTGTLTTELMDVARHYVNGALVSWQNEWGALRGTSPHSWGDSLVRGIRTDGDGITAGRFIELNDRRTGAPSPVMYGRKWRDGMLVRNGVDMADVWVRVGNTPIPPTLPPGTVVVQI